MNGLFFIGELVGLYILSRALTKQLFRLGILVFRSRTVAVVLVTLVEFPGTVIHELAHLFTATILGVRAGKLSLVPENIRDNRIQMGSVMIAETDPFRRYAIGLAPVFVGIIVLSALSSFFPQLINKSIHDQLLPLWQNPNTYLFILVAYLTFAVSNSMFSSKEDLEGFLPFLIVVGLFMGGFYFLGIRIGITPSLLTFLDDIVGLLVKSLGAVLIVNIILLAVSFLLFTAVSTMTRRRFL